MKVLLTGAFGNVGTGVVHELLKGGHTVRCFDLDTRANRQAARRRAGQVEVMWGDLRRPEDIATAVRDQEVVVHLAFIIPKLSTTGIQSEEHPDRAWEVNVGGTRNLLAAMRELERPPAIIFASSCHIYGRTQDLAPPRLVSDPPRPIEHYARHKVECEQMIRTSGLRWTVFRLAAALPISIKLDPGMFDVPLNNRIEFVHTLDVGTAIANAIDDERVWGKILHIGGGPRCRYYYREIVERILEAIGVGMLPEEAFSRVPFATDWLDTRESQELLHYQQRDLDDYVRDMLAAIRYKRVFIAMLRPLVRHGLLSRSPYYREARHAHRVRADARP